MRLLFAFSMTVWQLLTAALGVSAYAADVSRNHLRANSPYRKRTLDAPSLSVSAAPTAIATTSAGQPDFTFDQLYNLQTRFLDTFLIAVNTTQADLVNSSVLAENVQGRVDITRTFEGRELNTEYLFGLFANLAASTSVSLLGFPTSYEIIQFAANANIASVATRFVFQYPALNLSLPVVVYIWSAFNAAGEIAQYDATFRRFEWMIDTITEVAGATLGANSPEETQQRLADSLAQSICGTAARYCNGTNVQYNSTAACTEFLTKDLRFGKPYELGRNTLLCRMVHQNMVAYRPDIHCSHIGPTGGGYCSDDLTYEGVVNDNYFTNSPFVPYMYSKNQTGGLWIKTQ